MPRIVSIDGKKGYVLNCSNCGKEVRYVHRSKPKKCPYCSHKYFDKPLHEFKLFNLQDEFIENNRDPDILAKMFPILIDYAKNIILSKFATDFNYPEDLLYERAHDNAGKMIEYYLSKDDYIITDSFGGYLKKTAKWALYRPQVRSDKNVSLSATISDSEGAHAEMLDLLSTNVDPSLLQENSVEMILEENEHTKVNENIDEIITYASDAIRETEGSATAILVMIGLYHYLTKKEAFQTDFLDVYGRYCRHSLEKLKTFLYNYLRGEI